MRASRFGEVAMVGENRFPRITDDRIASNRVDFDFAQESALGFDYSVYQDGGGDADGSIDTVFDR